MVISNPLWEWNDYNGNTTCIHGGNRIIYNGNITQPMMGKYKLHNITQNGNMIKSMIQIQFIQWVNHIILWEFNTTHGGNTTVHFIKPKMEIFNHIMEIYNFSIMEIVSQIHQWVLCMGIKPFPLSFP